MPERYVRKDECSGPDTERSDNHSVEITKKLSADGNAGLKSCPELQPNWKCGISSKGDICKFARSAVVTLPFSTSAEMGKQISITIRPMNELIRPSKPPEQK